MDLDGFPVVSGVMPEVGEVLLRHGQQDQRLKGHPPPGQGHHHIIIPHQVRVREHDGNEDFLPLGVGVGQIQEVCPIQILPDVQGLEEDVDLGNHPLQFVRWRHYDPSLTWEYSWKYLSSVDLPAPTLPSTCNEPIRGQYYQD